MESCRLMAIFIFFSLILHRICELSICSQMHYTKFSDLCYHLPFEGISLRFPRSTAPVTSVRPSCCRGKSSKLPLPPPASPHSGQKLLIWDGFALILRVRNHFMGFPLSPEDLIENRGDERTGLEAMANRRRRVWVCGSYGCDASVLFCVRLSVSQSACEKYRWRRL